MRDFHLPGRSPVLAANGLCATSHPLAARTAIDILTRGGNAMDAAIAGAVLLGLCEPHMTGLGGDCFVLHSRPGAPVQALNGSGRAPAAASAAALRAEGHRVVPPDSAAAVTVPGAVDAFCRLAAEQGRLGLDTLLAPAIAYAEEAVPEAPREAADWAAEHATLRGAARAHYLIDGKPPAAGAVFRAPGQAEVLRRIARDGRGAFYDGEVAEDMLAALAGAGGVHTAADLADHESLVTTPLRGTYGGTELIEHPPNGQGATAILMLAILAHFDNLALMDPLGPQRAHIEAEAAKLAYDARNRFIADPDHTARLDHMLAPGTAARLAALIDPANAMPAAAPLTEAVHRDTVYITVVDRDRMAVSLIYSLFRGFGSGIASERFGLLLQNRGSGFCLTPGHPNEMAGGKRPMHTIIPAMLAEGGRVSMPFGVMGGAYQPAGHARLVSNLVDFGMDPQTAIDAPRCFADGGTLRVERGYPEATRRALAEMGHDVTVPRAPIGGAQAVRIRDGGVLEGGSDPRKDGIALGY